MIKNDCPTEAPPATPEEREYVLNVLSRHITPDHVIIMDDEARRGEYRYTPPKKKKLQSGDRVPGSRSGRCR